LKDQNIAVDIHVKAVDIQVKKAVLPDLAAVVRPATGSGRMKCPTQRSDSRQKEGDTKREGYKKRGIQKERDTKREGDRPLLSTIHRFLGFSGGKVLSLKELGQT